MVYSDVVKSVSGNQHEILWNIMQLFNGGKPFDCDITYSVGGFYGEHKITNNDGEQIIVDIPQPKYKFDVYPQTADTVKIDAWGQIPLEDKSIDSIVVDLPFVITVGPSLQRQGQRDNIIARRFSGYYPARELYESYAHWIAESYRVLKDKGLCVFKTQATVSGGINHDIPRFSCMCAERESFVVDDQFVLTAKARLISGKIKRQMHARKFHSFFLIFRKWKSKKYDKINFYKLVDDIHRNPTFPFL